MENATSTDISLLQLIGDDNVLQQFMSGHSTFTLLLITVVCIALLSRGADWMIDGVVVLAERTGMSRIVIGATIVSLGTTLPEAFVSVMAAFMGNPGLALGNGRRLDNRGHRPDLRPDLCTGRGTGQPLHPQPHRLDPGGFSHTAGADLCRRPADQRW